MVLLTTLIILLLIATFSGVISNVCKENIWRDIQDKLEFEKEKQRFIEKNKK